MKNLRFAAMAYLNNWCSVDRDLVAGLSPERTTDERRVCLRRIAAAYRIARNFEKVAAEKARLELALGAVDRVGSSLTDENVDSIVCNLADEFKNHYGKRATSAASKFLWFRYQSPVVMYDSQARAYLGSCGTTYASYRAVWLEQYARNKEAVKEACADLLQVKSFSLASEIADEKLASLVAAGWFRERVFDWFLWGNGRPQRVVPAVMETQL